MHIKSSALYWKSLVIDRRYKSLTLTSLPSPLQPKQCTESYQRKLYQLDTFTSTTYVPPTLLSSPLNPTTGHLVLNTKLEQITLSELNAIAKLAHTGPNLGCPLTG